MRYRQSIKESCGIPTTFHKVIVPYIRVKNPQTLHETSELIRVWEAALAARATHPQCQEAIAEWTMSAAASSPLIDTSFALEEIHNAFGSLEVPGDTKEEWLHVQRLVEDQRYLLQQDTIESFYEFHPEAFEDLNTEEKALLAEYYFVGKEIDVEDIAAHAARMRAEDKGLQRKAEAVLYKVFAELHLNKERVRGLLPLNSNIN